MAQAKGRRDGIPPPSRDGRPAAGQGGAWQGPRTVVLRKNSQGFGFTLRHFIVYPPESALHTGLKEEENGNGKGCQRGRLEPMDTIFVKNVRDKGPAHQAGLCTGDRLVKVNGESVLGKTYSQVIALIQSCQSILELSIMPKDEDVLQLAYSQDAYLKGNQPYTGGAQNLPDPPPVCYPTSRTQAPMGQNQLDNRSGWLGSSGLSSPLDNCSGRGSPASWHDGLVGDSCHGSPMHRAEEAQYGPSGQQATGQSRGRSASSPSSSGPSSASPLHAPYTHHSASQAQVPTRKGSQPWTSPPQPVGSRSKHCQQALADWYYSQVPERTAPTMPPRHRSFSQDRLGEAGSGPGHHRMGWPHSASQDTLLLQPDPSQQGDAGWAASWGQPSNRARSENLLATKYDRFGRSLEALERATALVSPRLERPVWLQQAQPRTQGYQRPGNHYGGAMGTPTGTHSQAPLQQPPPQPRRPPLDDQPVGYRSYSPSFYRKAGHLMQAHSFRDPSYTGPHFTWTPTPHTSPPEKVAATALVPCSSAPAPVPQDAACRLTNHEREREEPEVATQAQEVVLRQKPPMGRRTPQGQRNPHYGLPAEGGEPLGFPGQPHDSGVATRRANGGLAPLPFEHDSLASIPYIDEPTSPSADLRAHHVPASSVVSSAMSSAPAIPTSPASPTFTFPLTRLFSHDCSSNKSGRRSSYMLAITTERSKSCDEGLNTFRDEGHVFSRLPKRVKSFFTDGSLDSLAAAEEARSKRHSTSELGSITFSNVRKEGWLQYKQILTEKGKKVGGGMRPWKRAYSVLRSHSLFLYKDKREAVLHGAAAGGAGLGEEEQPISIRGCLVDIAYSETKRKHALHLTTQDFCEYLLQAEDRDDMLSWIRAIRENNKTDSEEFGFSGQALISKKLNDYRKQSPTGNKPDSSPRVPRIVPPFLLAKMENAVGVPRSPKPEGKDESSPPKSPWGINIMKKAKKSGPKAFGVRLEDCQPGVHNKFVPLVVEICCGLVEEMGLEYTGIYRVPGNNAMVSSLQDQLNKGIDINPAEEKWQDLNVISSLLKSFFRKLPEPVFTDDKYNDFIQANRSESTGDRLKTMKKLIHDLPDYYYHTLKFLVGHLKTVADHSEKNKMEPRNLALVFGPTLVRTSEDNMTDMVTHMPDRYKIVETLIQHSDWFFNEEMDKDDKTPVDKEDLLPVPNIDHLLPNIGRTALLTEVSDSTNSDSAKSKGSWGSKRDLTTKDFLALSIMSAVTRKRKKRPMARLLGSSTDEDSEHEPVKASHRGQMERDGLEGGDAAPKAEGEEDEEEDEEDDDGVEKSEAEGETPGRPGEAGEESGGARDQLQEDAPAAARAQTWRGLEDAHSMVSGYSTLSTLGRTPASEADDERSEHVSETDNESGFASRSLTQERPEKPAQPLRSFLYTHYKPAPPVPPSRKSPQALDPSESSEGRARSATPSSSSVSSSSTTYKLHSRPSFNSHKLIQCDTLARKKLKGDKAKALSLDLDLELGPTPEDEGVGFGSAAVGQGSMTGNPRTTQETVRPSACSPLSPPLANEAASFSPAGVGGQGSLAEQVRARLLGSADDLRNVGRRQPLSPETRRRRRAWRRHTVVVNLGTQDAQPELAHEQTKPSRGPLASEPQGPGEQAPLGGDARSPAARPAATSRFHQYL